MGLARDGSIGVLTMHWRRVEIDGLLYVEEGFSTDALTLYGPVPDVETCTALIRERAATVRALAERMKADLLARFPGSVRFNSL